MITPVRNISFNSIKKQNKVNKNHQTQNYQALPYVNSTKLNFSGYLSKKPKVGLEYGVENNFFKLPKKTLDNGEVVQIQPDKSQMECAKWLCDGKNVLFDAPTGMGKTSVAHFAMNKNLSEGKRTIYTVPIKALANDKYVEFSKIYGHENVGILTGDRKINGSAPIVIMTTEIFDNQAQGMHLNDALKIGTVVYDEAHYIGDEERGMAWENSIINAASRGVQILALSATIGNADEFASWVGKIPGARPSVRVEVPSSDRPVPLVWHLFRHDNEGDRLSPIMYGEIDLSSDLEDLSYEVINYIYKTEMQYWEKRHEANKEKRNYNDRFLKDSSYKAQINPKLERALGKEWINADFSDVKVYEKLKEEFPSLIPADMLQINEIASKSGVRALTDRQKRALEVLYKTEYGESDDYQMTNDDYEFAYQQLKMGIGEGQNNFKFDTESFKKRLKREFRSLDKTQLDQVTQLISKPDVKSISAIHENWRNDDYVRLVRKLEKEDMLPAIIFKLAQGGCEQVADNLAGTSESYEESELNEEQLRKLEEESESLDLLTSKEKEQVQEIIDKYEKNGVYLGKNLQKNMLLRGWGVHHAGRLPQYKKLIEELFAKKLIKVVVATSTLGAGINMPARTVVMTNTAYKKYDSKTEQLEFVPLTSNEFHQMTGRAGRRGIDDVGHVVLYNLHTPPDKFRKDELKDKNGKIDELWLAYNLMKSPADDVRSSFRPQPVQLAKYYSQAQDSQGLWKLIKQSFKIHLAKDKDKAEKQMRKKFENFSLVLTKLGCVAKNHKKELTLTPKGEILAQSQGMNPLMLATLLYDEKLAKMNPVQLAQIAAHIQGTSEQKESEASRILVSNKVKYAEIATSQMVMLNQFESTKAQFEFAQEKVLKALKEANVNKNDIKQTDSFSGYVGYMFASLNQSESNSIANFEKIVASASEVSSSDSEANKEYARKATEGNVYKIITGAISTLKQMIRICDFAIMCDDMYPNTFYWQNVKENAQIALELLDKEPINNDPNYANKLSNI